jgi:hypothetical protein
MKTDLRKIGCVDGTGSGSCPMAFVDISGVEASGSAIRVLVYWAFFTLRVSE